MSIKLLICSFNIVCFTSLSIYAASVTFSIDATKSTHAVSPYIYGKNAGISQQTGTATSADTLQRYRDAGFKILRLNNGNNATKYNWERKLTSHPDWYNNVYATDWDQSAGELARELPGVQGLFALPLLGWAASNTEHNFNDWLYNQSTWWWDSDNNMSGLEHNWAGTTAISVAGQKPTDAANPSLYLEKRTPEQAVGILDHFFGTGTEDLGLNQNQFQYWNMDNEPDIWSGTHDDVMPDTLSAEEFIQIYVEIALKAKKAYPNIKLVGPVATNEWQWFYWHSEMIVENGTSYSFLEYFIKQIANAEKTSGKKLLDVFDLHFYPGYSETEDIPDILQLHRIWFDTSYVFPKANGVKWAMGSTREYILQRVRNWLDTYMGENHGVTLGVTEVGSIDGAKDNASAIAVWYASQLGEFGAAGDVEIFTPWTQYTGMFEAIHLFTRYAKNQSFEAENSADNLVSAYTTINETTDSMTVILVNRNLSGEENVTVNLSGFTHGGSWAPTFDIAYLQGETFVSESDNAIYKNAVDVANGSFSITLPPLSVTAVILSTTDPGVKPSYPDRTLFINRSAKLAEFYSARVIGRYLYLNLPYGVSQAMLFDIHGGKVLSWNLSIRKTSHTLFLGKIPVGRYWIKIPGFSSKSLLILKSE